MPRSLADGHTRFVLLTTKPANPAAPTLTELNAGIHASPHILASDFSFGAAASDKLSEADLCTDSNAQVSTRSNYVAGFTVFRYFDETTGESDPTEGDDVFQAVKAKGATVYAYARRTSKKCAEAFEAGDELFFGAEISTDNLTPPSDMGGWIKWRQDADVQDGYPFIEVAAGA